jgi:hypothetical protein
MSLGVCTFAGIIMVMGKPSMLDILVALLDLKRIAEKTKSRARRLRRGHLKLVKPKHVHGYGHKGHGYGEDN